MFKSLCSFIVFSTFGFHNLVATFRHSTPVQRIFLRVQRRWARDLNICSKCLACFSFSFMSSFCLFGGICICTHSLWRTDRLKQQQQQTHQKHLWAVLPCCFCRFQIQQGHIVYFRFIVKVKARLTFRQVAFASSERKFIERNKV